MLLLSPGMPPALSSVFSLLLLLRQLVLSLPVPVLLPMVLSVVVMHLLSPGIFSNIPVRGRDDDGAGEKEDDESDGLPGKIDSALFREGLAGSRQVFCVVCVYV